MWSEREEGGGVDVVPEQAPARAVPDKGQGLEGLSLFELGLVLEDDRRSARKARDAAPSGLAPVLSSPEFRGNPMHHPREVFLGHDPAEHGRGGGVDLVKRCPVLKGKVLIRRADRLIPIGGQIAVEEKGADPQDQQGAVDDDPDASPFRSGFSGGKFLACKSCRRVSALLTGGGGA